MSAMYLTEGDKQQIARLSAGEVETVAIRNADIAQVPIRNSIKGEVQQIDPDIYLLEEKIQNGRKERRKSRRSFGDVEEEGGGPISTLIFAKKRK